MTTTITGAQRRVYLKIHESPNGVSTDQLSQMYEPGNLNNFWNDLQTLINMGMVMFSKDMKSLICTSSHIVMGCPACRDDSLFVQTAGGALQCVYCEQTYGVYLVKQELGEPTPPFTVLEKRVHQFLQQHIIDKSNGTGMDCIALAQEMGITLTQSYYATESLIEKKFLEKYCGAAAYLRVLILEK